MYNEMSFLFNMDETKINNKNNTQSIFKSPTGKKYTVKYRTGDSFSNTEYIKNDIKSNVYKNSQINNKTVNPYTQLIEDSNGSMELTAADFCYLKDLGRYPLNRLIILRRYQEGVVVPNNLNDFNKENGPKPLATLIGWIDEEDDSLLDLNFSEEWDISKDNLHQLITKIVDQEFGTDLSKVIPSYAWSQGLLFGFLNKVGLTKDFNYKHIPQGDPNVLQEGAKRKGGGFDNEYTLKSSIKLKFRTAYIQRMIGDIDPGSAFSDILNNLTRFGTSDVKYVYNASNEYIKDLTRNSYSTDPDNWGRTVKKYAIAMSQAVAGLIKRAKQTLTELSEGKGSVFKKTNSDEENKKDKDKEGGDKDNFLNKSGKTLMQEANKALEKLKDLGSALTASTIMKYRWEMIGAVAAGTGINSTPWHMTVGNPYSPVISVGNIVVEDVALSMGNSFAFNDMPSELYVDVSLKFGRNLGGQEIRKMFNNSYTRDYLPKEENKK